MIHLSHPTGNRNVREALAAFDEANLLARFTTTVAWRGGVWNRILPARLISTLERRSYPESILARTLTHPSREILRLLFASGLGSRWATHETGALSTDGIFRNFDHWTSNRIAPNINAVHCYEDSALETFKVAKARGLKCIYEHPVGYWRYVETVFEAERELAPEYLSILPGLNDSDEKRARKDEEIGTADLILLSSNYSVKSLSMFPGILPKVDVIPYGAPGEIVNKPSPPGRKLRVIFVGGLSQVKGLSYMVEALNQVRELIEITVVGRRIADCPPLDDFLKTVNWIESVPHSRVLELMRGCDVLILPSLSDGFGLVVLEAMSQGLTAIVSDHSGVADVIEEGVNGFVAPVRGVECMVSRLELLAKDSERLAAMKGSALSTVAQFTWERYRESLVSSVSEL